MNFLLVIQERFSSSIWYVTIFCEYPVSLKLLLNILYPNNFFLNFREYPVSRKPLMGPSLCTAAPHLRWGEVRGGCIQANGASIMNTQCIVGSPECQQCFEFITFHYSNCCILRVKTMRNNRETDKNKSGRYKVKSWHKWLLLITENLLLKKSYQFLRYACAHLCTGRYAPGFPMSAMFI